MQLRGEMKMRIKESKLRSIIRTALIEHTKSPPGPNPYPNIDYVFDHDPDIYGGTFVISQEDVQFWADRLGIEVGHPMNPRTETGRYAPKYHRDGFLMLYADPYDHDIRIMHGDYASGWHQIIGLVDHFNGKWYSKIYVDGGYGEGGIEFGNPEDIRDPSNEAVFKDFFKNWLRYSKGQSRGSFEYAGTWD